MLLAGEGRVSFRAERSGVEDPVALQKVISAGSFDFAQDDVAWKLVKLEHE